MPTLIKPSRMFSDSLLTHYRQQGDAPADAVVAAVADAGGREGISQLMRWLADTSDFATDKQLEAVRQFFAQSVQLPTWADAGRMARGMAFFKKHAGLVGLTLGTYSLPYTYMGANGVQLLWLTERIKNDTARRLQETGEWVFAVNNPAEWAVGRAALRTVKIRLIHAAARWFGLHSGRWDMAWGVPVNQEDMAGTIGSFSYIVIRGLRKAGVRATEQEEEDYLHHINVIGYLNGVADELLPRNLREAFHLDRMIAKRQFAPSEAGAGLTQSLLNAIAEVAGQARPGQAGSGRAVLGPAAGRPESVRNLAAAQMRFFLGDVYANALGIPLVPVETQLISALNKLPLFSKLIPAAPAMPSA